MVLWKRYLRHGSAISLESKSKYDFIQSKLPASNVPCQTVTLPADPDQYQTGTCPDPSEYLSYIISIQHIIFKIIQSGQAKKYKYLWTSAQDIWDEDKFYYQSGNGRPMPGFSYAQWFPG